MHGSGRRRAHGHARVITKPAAVVLRTEAPGLLQLEYGLLNDAADLVAPITSPSRRHARFRRSTSTTARKTASSRRRKAGPSTTWRNRQTQPTPERYKEIQNALVAKGYLQPEQATGVWDGTSADALKKFQAGQNLEPTGKISSLSLIALGLGPKHDSPPPAAAPPAQPPQPSGT